MMSIAALIRSMAEAGATPEAIALAVEAIEALQQIDSDRKAKRAEQKRNERDRKATVARQSLDIPSPKEKSPTPPKEITPSLVSEPNGSSTKARANDLSEFKAELSELDAERLNAIIKHRRSKNGQLTGHSARLFRRDAGACGLSLQDAVDTCISRNWITVKPEYLAERRHQATSPPRKPNAFDAYDEIARLKGWNDEPGIIPSTDKNAERLSAVGGGASGVVVDLRRGHDWRC